MVDQDRVVAALPAYEIGSELGRGACGVVLAGRHRQLGRLVAIKQLPRAFGADPAVRARFLSEARVLATLDHPHVVAIYDFVDHEGLCLLVMERLTGGTVWSRFHAGGFTPDVSCAIVLALCAGLHHAHQHGILHRDVKPENLMFSGEGTLKVTDLGIAKVIGGSSTLATRHGEILGTPAYIAPEQAQGYELTPATDVYAAGTLLYELLAGRLPFPADTDPATLVYRHVHESPPPLREVAHAVPADLCAVVDRAISKAPSDRYQSAEEFGVAVARCAARTWGRGWLSRTNVPVSASGPILTAALGETEAGDKVNVPTAVESPQPTNELQEPVAGDFLPIQLLHPEYRDEDGPGEAGSAAAPPPTAPTIAPASVEAASVAPAASAPPAPPTIVAGLRSTPDHSSGAGVPPQPPPGAAPLGGDGSGTSPRGRRLLVAFVAVLVVGALIAAAVAISGGGGSKKKPITSPTSHTVASGGPPAVLSTALWKTLPSAPTARQQVGAAVANGTLWVLGGLTSGTSTAKV
jgi:serine/threonine-protein kinase